MNKQQQYAAALDTLDRMRADGQVSENDYQLKRTRLIAEGTVLDKSGPVRFITGVAMGVAFLIVAAVVLYFFSHI